MINRPSPVASGGLDARGEDRQQLITLAQRGIDELGRSQVHLPDKLEPGAGLAKFLETYPALVNEIAAGFGGLNFPVVCERRRAGASQLNCDVLPERSTGEPLTQPTAGAPETYQSIFQVVPRHAAVLHRQTSTSEPKSRAADTQSRRSHARPRSLNIDH